MSFRISKDIGKIGFFVPVDFAKREPIYEHIEKDLEDGLLKSNLYFNIVVFSQNSEKK